MNWQGLLLIFGGVVLVFAGFTGAYQKWWNMFHTGSTNTASTSNSNAASNAAGTDL